MKKTNFKAILKTMAVVAFLSGCNLAANNANFSNDQTSLEHEAEIYNQNSAIVIQLPGGSNSTERATYSLVFMAFKASIFLFCTEPMDSPSSSAKLKSDQRFLNIS